MAAYACISGDQTNAAAILILRLAALAEAVAELRQAQHRAAQAAAERLHAVVRLVPPVRSPTPPRAPTAASLAAQAFPGPPVPYRSAPGVLSAPGERQRFVTAARPS